MIQLRKILFPTDFSHSADQALNHALYLARQYGAELHLLHVLVLHGEDPNDPEHRFPDDAQLLARLGTFAGEPAEAAGESGDFVVVRAQRREVSAAPAIVDYAEEQDIDVIVMGTHGRRGVRHLLAGSVTEEVVRTAPCTVLSVRAQREPRTLAHIRQILAPVDFSESSKAALDVARELADTYAADLQMLHVWENVLHPAFYNMGATSIRDLQPDIEERTLKALRNLADSSGIAGEVTYHTAEGPAAREIVRFADRHASDLIVIATHGLTGLDHFLLGSVTEKVVRRAPCPVLVARRKKSDGGAG